VPPRSRHRLERRPCPIVQIFGDTTDDIPDHTAAAVDLVGFLVVDLVGGCGTAKRTRAAPERNR